MLDPRPDRAIRLVVAAAALVVVLAGLKSAADVTLPFVFAVFLSIAAQPLVHALQRRGVPTPLAIGIVVLLAAALLSGVTTIMVSSVRRFTQVLSQYGEQLELLGVQVASVLGRFGVDVAVNDLGELVTPDAALELLRSTLESLARFLGRTLIVLVSMTFILLESADIEQKFRVAFGGDAQVPGPFSGSAEKVQQYLLIKTATSLATGVAAGLSCWAIGLQFWVLWGVLAFLLNYIPTIGWVVAGLPPLMLAVVDQGTGGALALIGAYVAIHVVLANLLEPRLLGQGLGLSPLVVFLSLIFWGWMWGPVGMLLCVPMTAMVQLVLDSSDETRWIAVFLGSPRAIRKHATGQPARPRAHPSSPPSL